MRATSCLLTLLLLPPVAPAADEDNGEKEYYADYALEALFKKRLEKAEAGDAESQYEVGSMYLRGRGVPPDTAEAARWIRQAAEQDNTRAQAELGELYMEGEGVSQDYAAARRWLSRAAEAGYPTAQFRLGQLYAEGRGVERDYDRALEWLTRAVDGGYAYAEDEIEKARAARAQTKRRRRAEAQERAARKAAAKEASSGDSEPQAGRREQAAAAREAFALLELGDWFRAGEPAERLPSSANTCSRVGAKMVCTTGRRESLEQDTNMTYELKATLSDFASDRRFRLTYRRHVLRAMPANLDDPNAEGGKLALEPYWEDPREVSCRFTTFASVTCTGDGVEDMLFSR
ncbi:MAG: sel1 repeat family protein [Gammaproteobacteria bacterium]|nr:sel1 repeat family protein [Gammaproteobacteria bacterium]